MADQQSGGTSGYEVRGGADVKFGFAPVQAPQARATYGGQIGRIGISGGMSSGGVIEAAAPPAPAGWGAIDNVIEDVMRPKIKAKQQEEFWKGVTAARAGVAVADIVRDQSPLTKIFGPSSYVQGAQFYAAQDKLAGYNQQMLESAEELAALPPAELGKRLNADSQKYSTGDPGTDAIMQAAWIEQTAPALAVVTRTRYAQQQKAATNAFVANAGTNADNLQMLGARLGNGTATTEDYDSQRAILAQALQGPVGMANDTYHQILPSLAKEWADKGNFHAVTMLKQSGALNHMDLEKRTKLDEYVDRKEKAAAERERFKASPELAKITGALKAGAMSSAEYTAHVRTMNTKFQQDTGAMAPMVPYAEMEQMMTTGVGNWYEGQAKLRAKTASMAEKATTLAEKEAVEAREVEQISTLIASGSAQEAIDLFNLPAHKVTSAEVRLYDQATPEAGDQMLIDNWKGSGRVNSVLKQRFQQGLRASVAGEFNPAVEKMHEQWKRRMATSDGRSMVSAYYDPDDRVRMERYDELLKSGLQAPVAFKVAYQDPLTDAVDYTKKHGDDKEIKAVVKDSFTTFFGKTGDGKTELNEFSQRLVAGLINKNVKTMLSNTGLTTAQAARQEINHLKANGLEVFGGTAWMKQPNQAPMASYIRTSKHGDMASMNAVDPNRLDTVFKDHVAAGMKAAGASKVENYQVLRLADINGKAQFAVIGYTAEGTYAPPYSFTSEDLTKSYEAALKAKVTSSAPKQYLAPKSMRFIEQAPDRIY